jgi:hypothetical protein
MLTKSTHAAQFAPFDKLGKAKFRTGRLTFPVADAVRPAAAPTMPWQNT